MDNIFDYVKKYGDYSFKEKGFNECDNLVLCALFYLDFSKTSIHKGTYTLDVIGQELVSNYDFKDISKRGMAQRNAYILFKLVMTKARYKKIVLSDYVYETSRTKQFGAITYKINKNLSYICFEGTDELVSGWREDGELACKFPVEAQKCAIDYVNEHVTLFGPNVIIGGHSKGGNLALISAMYTKPYKQFKIKKVYSNDGPGLRKKEFESKEYAKIKNKYIHIVPENSVVGVLLRNDTYKVVKATKNNIISHSICTWIINDNKLVEGTMTDKSKRLEASVLSWLDMHNDEEREKVVRTLFGILENAKITTIPNIKKLDSIGKIIQNINNIDKQTKDLLLDLIVFNYKNVSDLF